MTETSTTTPTPAALQPPAELQKCDGKDDFYARLYADPRDIMPSRQSPRTHTVWLVVRTGEVWGWTFPGYAEEGPKAYYCKAPRRSGGSPP